MKVTAFVFVLIFLCILPLPIQLLLCFKVKRKAIRALPAIVLSVAAIVFLYMGSTNSDWEALGYILFSILAGLMLFLCGIGWGIWWLLNRRKRQKSLK